MVGSDRKCPPGLETARRSRGGGGNGRVVGHPFSPVDGALFLWEPNSYCRDFIRASVRGTRGSPTRLTHDPPLPVTSVGTKGGTGERPSDWRSNSPVVEAATGVIRATVQSWKGFGENSECRTATPGQVWRRDCGRDRIEGTPPLGVTLGLSSGSLRRGSVGPVPVIRLPPPRPAPTPNNDCFSTSLRN